MRDVAIPKGVNCFEYCSKANIIATGGVDKVIRVWHPHIFSRPTGKVFLLDLKKKKQLLNVTIFMFKFLNVNFLKTAIIF